MASPRDCQRALAALFAEDRGRPAPARFRRPDPATRRLRRLGEDFLRSVDGDIAAGLGLLLERLDETTGDGDPERAA